MSFPSISLQRHLYSLTVGSAAGATVGLVGWGGAQIIIPAMAWSHPNYAGLSQLAATGVSLTSLSVSTLSSGWEYWREGNVNVPLAAVIGASSTLSALWGTRLAQRLSGPALALVFDGLSVFMIPTHYWIQCRAEERKSPSSAAGQSSLGMSSSATSSKERAQSAITAGADTCAEPVSASRKSCTPDRPTLFGIPTTIAGAPILQHVMFGALSGVVSALMGVGGLPLTVSYITVAARLEHHLVQGTAICAVVPAVTMSALSRMSVVPPMTAMVVSVGAATGGYIGAKGALYLTEDTLRHLYMGSLVIFGGRAVFGAGKNIFRVLSRK